MRRAHRPLTGLLAAGALALTGCAQSVEPAERLGGKAVRGAAPEGREAGAAGSEALRAHGGQPHGGPEHGGPAPRSGAPYARWGLREPLRPAPAPPVRKPDRPFVVDRVPTRDKVVFLTFGDGAAQDSAFVRLVDELDLPVSVFLTDGTAAPGHRRFVRPGRAGGGSTTVQNHGVGHVYLPGLPYAGQRAQICGQRDRLEARFGTRPRLFRPPYGAYDNQTLRAAGDCGADAVVLWWASAQGGALRYARGDRLRPGDIVFAHSRRPGELAEATVRVLRRVQEQGFAVARLEEYL
ncbi:polysaccharide deacetylase family protein [Streptomyces enissocaesilis]|uniref:NodB homology domain-containing protein n=1 Tax=Streptomyces enissocaesilis TaxID=332589 RepID=A0ABN3X7R0_9ACTN